MRQDFDTIVNYILNSEEFQKRKTFMHHYNISVYEHSLKVAKLSYKISLHFKHFDSNSIAVGALLHDFYYKDWQSCKEKRKFFQKHGFVHAREALLNSEKYFPELMNEKVKNIIERHMFPLNIHPPKYKEAWLVSTIDKIVSMETFLHPSFYLRLLGIKS